MRSRVIKRKDIDYVYHEYFAGHPVILDSEVGWFITINITRVPLAFYI